MTLPKYATTAARSAPSIPAVLGPSSFPDLYGMSVDGGCMAPDLPDGCNIKVSKTEPYKVGDIVCIWFRPELVRPGRHPGMIKRLAMEVPPWVKSFPYEDHPKSEVLALLMFQSNDQPDSILQVRASAVFAMHKVLGILAPEETGPDFRDEAPAASLRAERKRKRLSRAPLRSIAP